MVLYSTLNARRNLPYATPEARRSPPPPKGGSLQSSQEEAFQNENHELPLTAYVPVLQRLMPVGIYRCGDKESGSFSVLPTSLAGLGLGGSDLLIASTNPHYHHNSFTLPMSTRREWFHSC